MAGEKEASKSVVTACEKTGSMGWRLFIGLYSEKKKPNRFQVEDTRT
jgi:hypothetical protein